MSLTYETLDHGSIHIRLFPDAALKNLDKTGSQLGVLVALADNNDTFLVLSRLSTRANRTPINTYESELLAMFKASRFHENFKRVFSKLVDLPVRTVYFVDKQTCWL